VEEQSVEYDAYTYTDGGPTDPHFA